MNLSNVAATVTGLSGNSNCNSKVDSGNRFNNGNGNDYDMANSNNTQNTIVDIVDDDDSDDDSSWEYGVVRYHYIPEDDSDFEITSSDVSSLLNSTENDTKMDFSVKNDNNNNMSEVGNNNMCKDNKDENNENDNNSKKEAPRDETHKQTQQSVIQCMAGYDGHEMYDDLDYYRIGRRCSYDGPKRICYDNIYDGSECTVLIFDLRGAFDVSLLSIGDGIILYNNDMMQNLQCDTVLSK